MGLQDRDYMYERRSYDEQKQKKDERYVKPSSDNKKVSWAFIFRLLFIVNFLLFAFIKYRTGKPWFHF